MWHKKGLIFSEHHAQLPTIYRFKGKIFCLYATKDVDSKSTIRVFDLEDKPKSIGISLGLGEKGCFDQDGVSPGSVIVQGDRVILYYNGWYANPVSYTHSIGIAISFDGIKFERLTNCPLISRGMKVPYLANSPFVYDGGNSMIFANGTGWYNGKPTYSLARAISNDGIEWKILDWLRKSEYGVYSRVHLDEKGAIYYSYFDVRNPGYKIYKNDELVLDVGDSWDSEMTAYPFIFEGKMYYNGNGYGRTGIGVAEWVDE